MRGNIAASFVNFLRKQCALNALKRAMRRVNVNYCAVHVKQGTSNNYFRRAPRLIQAVAAGMEGGLDTVDKLSRLYIPRT